MNLCRELVVEEAFSKFLDTHLAKSENMHEFTGIGKIETNLWIVVGEGRLPDRAKYGVFPRGFYESSIAAFYIKVSIRITNPDVVDVIFNVFKCCFSRMFLVPITVLYHMDPLLLCRPRASVS